MFEKEKYYQYIQTIEKTITAMYIVIIVAFMFMGYLLTFGMKAGPIIGIGIGFAVAKSYTLGMKIKIQKMKWEIDIYNKINTKNDTL